MQIYEVKVISNGVNVALNKTVTMSSVKAGLPGSNVVDGNLGTYTHSEGGKGSLRIDLGAEYPIQEVQVFNAVGTVSGRLIGSVIKIKNAAEAVVFTSDPFKDTGGGITPRDRADVGYYSYSVKPPATTLSVWKA